MPLTRAEITKAQRDRKKSAGLKKVESWVIDNEEARQQLKAFVAELNKRFNCVNFKGAK